MTVCIAALCEGNIILAASDRMITSGDVQFEPATQKVQTFTSSIAVMFAGDAALHSEVFQIARGLLRDRLDAEPERWLPVVDAAEMFVTARNRVKLRRAEAAVLQPLGMTADDFRHGNHNLGAELTKAIATDMIGYQLPSTSWIICGVDDAGAHIYAVYDGYLTCQDQVGFAAIGSGGRRAESQLMLAEHNRWRGSAETLLMVYTAKKRAEVAPGVGFGTDVITAGPQPGTLASVNEAVVARVHSAYEQVQRDEAQALALAKVGMEIYVAGLGKAEPSEQVADSSFLDIEDVEPTDAANAEPDQPADDDASPYR